MENSTWGADQIDESGHRVDRRRWITPVGMLLAACLLFLIFISDCGKSASWSPPDPAAHPTVGNRLPEVELEALTGSGGSIRSEDLAGSVVLINFWATWCGPCRDELPHIAQLGEEFSARDDFQLLTVSVGLAESATDLETLRQATIDFLDQEGLNVPTYADPNNITFAGFGDLALSLDPSAEGGLPTTIALDRKGIIRGVWPGYLPGLEIEMKEMVAGLLEEGD